MPAQPQPASTPATSWTAPTPPESHIFGSELERKAAEVRRQRAEEQAERDRFLTQQRAEQATFALALALKCHMHDAVPGQPCWKVAPDDLHHRAAKAVCGSRIDTALGIARLRRERAAIEARKQAKAARQQVSGR